MWCAGRDSNPRRPKPPDLQSGAIDHSATDALFLCLDRSNEACIPHIAAATDAVRTVCRIFVRATMPSMKREWGIPGVVLSALALAPSLALAVSINNPIVPQSCNGKGGCHSICDLATLAQNVMNVGIFVAVFLSAILFAWAGWKYVTAQGNSGQAGAAKKLFFNVMIGFVIILVAWIFVDVLMRSLTGNSNWSSLCGYSAIELPYRA